MLYERQVSQMSGYIKAAILKQKCSYNKVLLWLTPLVTILLALVLMGGNHLQDGAYNWWYMLLLPGCFTMFSAFTVTNECKKNRHGMLGIAVQKKELWLAQIIVCTAFLLVTCLFFFLFITIGGIICGQFLTMAESFWASMTLFLTFAWQIPLWMFITEKTGAFITILLSLFCNFAVPVICAEESFWWIPFSIPARLMCACIHILPNGLQVEMGSELADKGIILPGIVITLALFAFMTVHTTVWFEKCEV